METPLEQTARHVREGAERITKQSILVEKLREEGPADMLATAEQLLSDLYDFQKLGHEHLAREQAKLL